MYFGATVKNTKGEGIKGVKAEIVLDIIQLILHAVIDGTPFPDSGKPTVTVCMMFNILDVRTSTIVHELLRNPLVTSIIAVFCLLRIQW